MLKTLRSIKFIARTKKSGIGVGDNSNDNGNHIIVVILVVISIRSFIQNFGKIAVLFTLMLMIY